MSILESEAEWREVWKIYDLDKDGFITKEDFTSAVRVLGRRYTTEQMEEKMKKIPNRVDYESFIEFMHEPYDGPTKEDLATALKAFDGRDAGSLSKMEVVGMLTAMGDKLSDAELKVVIGAMPLNPQGQITLEALVAYFTPPVPSTKPDIPSLLRDLMNEELKRRELDEDLEVNAPLPQPAPMVAREVEGAMMSLSGGRGGGGRANVAAGHAHAHAVERSIVADVDDEFVAMSPPPRPVYNDEDL